MRKKLFTLSCLLMLLIQIFFSTYSVSAETLYVYGQPYNGQYDVWNDELNGMLENDIPGNPGWVKSLPDGELENRRKRVFQLLVGNGYTKEAAAGIVGNLWEESAGGYTALLEFSYADSWMRNGPNKCWTTALQDWSAGMTYGFGMWGFTASGPMFAVFDAAHEMNLTCFDVDPQVKGLITCLQGLESDGIFGEFVAQLKENKFSLPTEKYAIACAVTMTCAYERNWAYGQIWGGAGTTALKEVMKTGNLSPLSGYGSAGESFQFRAEKAVETYNLYKDLDGIDFGGNVTSSNKPGSSSTSWGSIKEEWEVVGFKNPLQGTSESIILANRDALSTEETVKLANISGNMQLKKSIDTWQLARVCLIFIGLFLITYAVLLGFAVILDNVRLIEQFSIVKVVTLGTIEYIGTDREMMNNAETDKNLQSVKGMLVFIMIFLIVGLLLVSGAILPQVMKIVYNITGAVNL